MTLQQSEHYSMIVSIQQHGSHTITVVRKKNCHACHATILERGGHMEGTLYSMTAKQTS